MSMDVEERIRNFARDQPVDCTNWLEFTVVESTYRYWKIRYLEKIDRSAGKAVQSPADNPRPESVREAAAV